MPDNRPAYSIVIPTYGRGDALARCLAALAELAAPAGGFEVVVVDDGGPKPLLDAIVARYSDRLPITLYRKQNGGPASARNHGAARAAGAYLVFTDDDCRPARDWLVRLAARLEGQRDIMVGGHTQNGLPGQACSTASQVLVDYLYASDNPDPESMRFITSNNMALPAAAFSALGGFDACYPRAAGEDREFCDRWRAGDRRIVYVARAVVVHYHGLNLRGFWRQHSNYGRGALRVHRDRARTRASALRLERAAFYIRLVGYPFTAGRARPLRTAALLAISQLATAAGFVAEAWALARQRGANV